MKLSKWIIISTILFGIFVVFKSPSDPDFGWHYKYGEYFVQHGEVLKKNIYSYTFSDYKWANSYWISEVALYLTHRYLGHLFAGLLFTAFLVASGFFYVRYFAGKFSSGLFVSSVALLLLSLTFASNAVSVRPLFFSCLFFMSVIAILWDKNRKYIWLLPVIFLLWANIHADFLLGLAVFGLFILIKMYESLREGTPSGKEIPHLVLVGLLSVGVTAINPFGTGLWSTLLKETNPYQFTRISEWVPISSDNPYFFGMFCVLIGLIAVSLIGVKDKLPTWYLLSTGIFVILSFRSAYFYRIGIILGVPAFIMFWQEPLEDLRKVLSAHIIGKVFLGYALLLSFASLLVFAAFYVTAKECVEQEYWVEQVGYPMKAADYAVSHGLKDGVLNYYGWGGYLIWKYPMIKTFVDGRMPSWRENGESVFEDYDNLFRYPKTYYSTLNKYKIKWVLFPADSKLATYLKTRSDTWGSVYSDETAVVFVRL